MRAGRRGRHDVAVFVLGATASGVVWRLFLLAVAAIAGQMVLGFLFRSGEMSGWLPERLHVPVYRVSLALNWIVFAVIAVMVLLAT